MLYNSLKKKTERNGTNYSSPTLIYNNKNAAAYSEWCKPGKSSQIILQELVNQET